MVRLPQGSVALEGPVRSGKTRLLIERAIELFHGHPSDSILVLCSNYYRKSQFLERVQEHLQGCYSQLQITTYSALIRNTLSLYWPSVEDLIVRQSKLGGHPVIFPELSGFEASEYIIKKIVLQLKRNNPEAFARFQGTDSSLITQLIRRVRLRSENRLERAEMRRRSELIGEECIPEVAEVLKEYDKWSTELRVLDNSKQIDVFHKLLETNPLIQRYFTDRIRHLIVDDVDETIPAQQHFVKFMAPFTETLTIAADLQGGTRRGYLNAYPYDWEGLKALKPEISTFVLKRQDSMFPISEQLLKNWLQRDPPSETKVLPIENEIIWRPQSLNRMEMVDQVVGDIVSLLNREPKNPQEKRFTPGDFVIVMPKVDVLARLQLQQHLKRRGIPLQILTGTQRPIDNPVCRSMLLLLQLINHQAWQMPLSPMELKGLLCHGLKLDRLDPEGVEYIITEYRSGLAHGNTGGLPTGMLLKPEALAHYQNMQDWLVNMQNEPIDEQLYSAFSQVISPHLTIEDELSGIHQFIRSLYIHDIAKAFLSDPQAYPMAAREWLIQFKTGIIADTPDKPHEINEDAIVLGTPQKVIDFEIERRVHFWLDISSREWSRTDNAPLYNAWVHSPNWDGDTSQASDNFNQLLTRTRAGHITRTLMLYAEERVLLYSSEVDEQGNAQTGIAHQMLLLPPREGGGKIERAILREDQARILTYEKGPMAITAVPGAGKTFINVELLLELIERGVPPDKILVLTYMDSAAKTLLNRLKRKLGQQTALPVVSTIHSLAMRIITEDDHSLYLGMQSDTIEITDDIEERSQIQPIVNLIDNGEGYFKNVEPVLSGIKLAKSYRLTPGDLKKLYSEKGAQGGRIIKFTLIYENYQRLLRTQGKVDFADLILKAIELLENFPEIREKYQSRFHYIIEDEAQDSSLLLQTFIDLIQQGHGNLIRTGDTNQSITTTFSTADTSVFRNFIDECQQTGLVIEMNQSSRCAQPVIDLANAFVRWACQDEILCNAFQPIVMKPVPDRNPVLLEPLKCMVFPNLLQEQSWIVSKIKELQEIYPDKSFAILLRSNQNVLNITRSLQDQGLKAICYTELPDLNPVFLIIVRVLKVLENPADFESMRELYTQMSRMGLLLMSESEIEDTRFANLLGLKPEDIENGTLLQLYYDVKDLLRYAFGQDICRLVVRLSDMFFQDPQQRSLGYLCAMKAQEWVNRSLQLGDLRYSPLELVNIELKACLDKKRLPFRAVQDTGMLPEALRNQFVQIMTLHKAKGQEFDFVFIPGMTEKGFNSLPNFVMWRESDKLELEIERLRLETLQEKAQLEADKKLKKIEEEARLIYVGLTRARQGLFLSCPLESADWRGKPENQQPSRYFEFLKTAVEPATIPTEELIHA